MTEQAVPAAADHPVRGSFFGHPKGLGYIVFTEAWERFSFYGMQGLLVLYMAGYLFQPGPVDNVIGFEVLRGTIESVTGPLSHQALATQLFGIYVGLVYFLPVFGGLLGDRVLGRTRAVLLGAVAMALGHFLLAFEAPFVFALLALICGSGLLKGNLAAQVGALYARNDQRRDSAFSLYIVSINVGATIAPLVCGTLGELYGWHYGFGAAGVGMMIGIVIYLRGREHLPPDELAGEDAPRQQLSPGDGRHGDYRGIVDYRAVLDRPEPGVEHLSAVGEGPGGPGHTGFPGAGDVVPVHGYLRGTAVRSGSALAVAAPGLAPDGTG